MNWIVIVDSYAKKFLKRIPNRDSDRIRIALREFIFNPYCGDIEKMEGKDNIWRRRIGSYRIFYEVLESKGMVYVYEIKRRTSNTY